MVAFFSPVTIKPARTTFEWITRLGLDASLYLSLEAGDARSYPGSGTVWTDLKGHVNYNISGSPAFAGVAGRKSGSEYFQMNGSSYFESAGDTSVIKRLHYNNSAFSLAAWVYYPSGVTPTTSPSAPLIATASPTNGSQGVTFRLNAPNGRTLQAIYSDSDGGGADVSSTISSTEYTENAWNFYGIGASMASDVLTLNVNANSRVEDGIQPTVTTPETDAEATLTSQIMNNHGTAAPSGVRIACLHLWNGAALTSAQFTQIKNATKGLFGL